MEFSAFLEQQRDPESVSIYYPAVLWALALLLYSWSSAFLLLSPPSGHTCLMEYSGCLRSLLLCAIFLSPWDCICPSCSLFAPCAAARGLCESRQGWLWLPHCWPSLAGVPKCIVFLARIQCSNSELKPNLFPNQNTESVHVVFGIFFFKQSFKISFNFHSLYYTCKVSFWSWL